MLNPPTKKQEQFLKLLSTRHGRKKLNLCFCEGIRSCSELLQRRPDLVEFCIIREDFPQHLLSLPEQFYVASKKWFDQFSQTVNSQGIIIVANAPICPPLVSSMPFIILLDQIADPGNMGTIIRTAAAVGLSEIWLTKGSNDPYSDKTIRAALGAQFALHLRFFENSEAAISQAREWGYEGNIYVTLPQSSASCFLEENLFNRSIIIFGGEANGIQSIPIDSKSITIPMPGHFESLNVAQATTVILFDAVRRNIF